MVSMDAGWSDVERQLQSMLLYKEGMAYMFDSGSYAIVHSLLDALRAQGRQLVVDVTSGAYY